MRTIPTPAEPRFRWTGVMILVPVLALGAVGLWQLRQDRAAALADAREEAENLLEEVFRVWKSFPNSADDLEQATAVFDTNGKLLWPKPIPLVPSPSATSNPQADKLNDILEDPTLTTAGQADALRDLATQENSGTTSAGFPVKQLALRNALRFGKEAGFENSILRSWAHELAIDAIQNPTLFTRRLLNEARDFNPEPTQETEAWKRAEASRVFLNEHSRVVEVLLVELANQSGEATLAKWIGSEAEIYCELRRDSSEIHLSTFTARAISQRANDLLKGISIPRHFGVRLSLADRLVHGNSHSEVLAIASDSESQLRAEIVFTDRAAFFQPIRQRSIRTAWLIALAVLAAGIGWFAAWRAFLKQRQLAAMKDNFVSAVSHELKTPIAAIGLMAEELGAGSQKRADYTKLIAGECARLGSLVENVLDYARFESGKNEFHFEEADLGELVRAVADLMRPPAAEREIEIQVEAPPTGELCATIDARAIGRALLNLLDNAIKYAPPNKPVTVSAAENFITVADQGTPIPAAERSQIFERFYRSGNELTRETKGVGIGLSLVQQIAEAHGGKVWVESDKTGNRFIFSLGNQ